MAHTRTVTGTIHKPDGSSWPDFAIGFDVSPTTTTAHATLPATAVGANTTANTITVTTDPDGAYSVDLEVEVPIRVTLIGSLVTSGTSTRYPAGAMFEIVVPDGDTPISLQTIRMGEYTAQNPTLVRRLETVERATAALAGGVDAVETRMDVAHAADGTLRGQSLQRSNLVTCLGDSITSQSGNSAQTDKGYLSWASLLSDSRIRWGGWQGGGGWTTQNMVDGALAGLVARDPAPGWCVVLAGTNDAGLGYALATTAANLDTIYQALLDANITPVCCSIPPRTGGGADVDLATAKINAWIAEYAVTHGLPFVDVYGALVDPMTGDYRAGLAADAVHPNNAGAKAIGQAIADVLAPLVTPSSPLLATDNSGDGLMLGNPLLLTDSNSDGMPDSWYRPYGIAEDQVTSLVPEPGAVLGNWLKLEKVGGTAASPVRWSGVPVSPGDRLYFACRFRWEPGAPNAQAGFGLNDFSPAIGIGGPLYTWFLGVEACTYANIFTVPEGVDVAGIEVKVSGGVGTFWLGQVTVRNLTALGIG